MAEKSKTKSNSRVSRDYDVTSGSSRSTGKRSDGGSRIKKANAKNSNIKSGKTASEPKKTKKEYTKEYTEESDIKEIRKENDAKFSKQVAPYIIIIIAIFLAICLFSGADSGILGGFVGTVVFGLFGPVAYSIPFLFVILVIIFYSAKLKGSIMAKFGAAWGLILCVSALSHLIYDKIHSFNVGELWSLGLSKEGGGAAGGIFGEAMYKAFGSVGAPVIDSMIIIFLVLFIISITPRGILLRVRYSLKVSREKRAERKLAEKEYILDDYEDVVESGQDISSYDDYGYYDDDIPSSIVEEGRSPEKRVFRIKKKRKFDTDVPIDDDAPSGTADGNDDDDIDLDSIFSDADLDRIIDSFPEGTEKNEAAFGELDLNLAGKGEEQKEPEQLHIPEVPEKKPAPKKPKYVFPPISLLNEDLSKKDENVREELKENAIKLVETLKSFNVKVKIENVSRGPTITRYEVLPEAGTRVRSIINLVDDIALNLATTGIRIEAPIPGKSAVGIEVPNKNRADVCLRTLLESKKFKSNTSKLYCALGADVAGEEVYLDISKMPHLLIAGATGMGKSVCLNSLIVSMLYNATPDELKFIMIDPKKVEFNKYNGIPHLLVPVVSDPKKAAGSLSWAVSEMERRFGLIEAVGAREIKRYNELTKNDPDYEFLPYIVIIIDEFADLMATSPDDVETSICRLMAKARAAGIHVIVGTQRPSVDVITGLIKSNIPSRIAFTVASQIDSRTIIDRAGAEGLIGSGDMLFMPVGKKPFRVQGAYISDDEVENITTFIKKSNSGADEAYSDEIMSQIEIEATKFGQGARRGDAAEDDGNEDPMLRKAVELAVESGKISTSLIQRKLSLGYGRAAKIIDRMEALGYVSAPEGQKPREVLITKEQFYEMVVNDDEHFT